MSDHDSQASPLWGSLELESTCPHDSRVDSTIDLTPQYSHIETEQDYESPTATDQYGCYSSSQCFDVTTTNFSEINKTWINYFSEINKTWICVLNF